jgi:hypothetical protein
VGSPNPGQPTNQFADVLTFSRYEAWAVGNRGQSGAYSTLMERYRNNNPCGGCPVQFSDVPDWSTFYQFVHCLACRNIISGYGDGTFRPNASVTRGQLAKIVSNAAGFAESHSEQSFQDVPVGSTFYLFIERLASRDIVSGYACGGEGEPCIAPLNRPYFRPGANVTRGQSAKVVALVAALPDPPSGTQSFEDVPPTHTFYGWIERMSMEGIISGYLCGGVGEPCVPPLNRPYFRSNASVTRGQSSKIVSNTFFPGCQALDR